MLTLWLSYVCLNPTFHPPSIHPSVSTKCSVKPVCYNYFLFHKSLIDCLDKKLEALSIYYCCFYYFGQNLTGTCFVDQAGCELPRSTFFCPRSDGITGMCHTTTWKALFLVFTKRAKYLVIFRNDLWGIKQNSLGVKIVILLASWDSYVNDFTS